MSVRYEIIIDPEAEERVIVYARSRDARVERLEQLLSDDGGEIIGYTGDSIIPIDLRSVSAFISEGGSVFAIVGGERIALKERLYSLEDRLGRGFLRLNQSCLANVSMIARFEATFGASLAVVFKDGYRDYVSRRQLKSVKERIGF